MREFLAVAGTRAPICSRDGVLQFSNRFGYLYLSTVFHLMNTTLLRLSAKVLYGAGVYLSKQEMHRILGAPISGRRHRAALNVHQKEVQTVVQMHSGLR